MLCHKQIYTACPATNTKKLDKNYEMGMGTSVLCKTVLKLRNAAVLHGGNTQKFSFSEARYFHISSYSSNETQCLFF
jgi:hypothetical protein